MRMLALIVLAGCAAPKPSPASPPAPPPPDARERIVKPLERGRAISRGAPAPLVELEKSLQDPAVGEAAAWALGRAPDGAAALQACIERGCPAAAASARALSGPGVVKAAP